MPDLVAAALGYLADGHHLLALHGKRPSSVHSAGWSWEDSIHGMPDTEAEVAALAGVFEDPEVTGIALLIPEHNLVADIDTPAASTLFEFLTRGEDWESTRISKTPNGYHVWFLSPGANKSLWLGGRALLLKGFGGYVVAPPSLHFDDAGKVDGEYVWFNPEAGIEFLPERMVKYIADLEKMAEQSPARAYEGSHWVLVPQLTGDGPWKLTDGTLKLVPGRNIEGLCKAIINAPDGNQNNIIAWAAMQARDEGVPLALAMPQLLDAAIQGGHPKDRAITTIKGVFTRSRRG